MEPWTRVHLLSRNGARNVPCTLPAIILRFFAPSESEAFEYQSVAELPLSKNMYTIYKLHARIYSELWTYFYRAFSLLIVSDLRGWILGRRISTYNWSGNREAKVKYPS